MADEKHDTIDKSEVPVVKRGTALSTPLLGIVLAIVGTAAMSYSFVNGISAALDGSSSGATPYIVAFFVGAALALIAIIIGIVGLIRGGHRILSVVSLLLGLVPAAFIVLIVVVNGMTVCCAQPVAG